MKLIRLPSSIIAAITATILSMPCQTLADTIVDTGEGFPGFSGGNTLWNLDPNYQNIAVEFTLASASEITSVEGWIEELGGTGNLTIGIGTAPGDLLFSGTYQSQAQGLWSPNQWEGLTGLNWSLEAGTYWVTFVAEPGFYGVLAGGAPQPLLKTAFSNQNYPDWRIIPNQSATDAFGIRILGNPQSIPDSGVSVIMFGGVLVGLASLRRRFPR